MKNNTRTPLPQLRFRPSLGHYDDSEQRTIIFKSYKSADSFISGIGNLPSWQRPPYIIAGGRQFIVPVDSIPLLSKLGLVFKESEPATSSKPERADLKPASHRRKSSQRRMLSEYLHELRESIVAQFQTPVFGLKRADAETCADRIMKVIERNWRRAIKNGRIKMELA